MERLRHEMFALVQDKLRPILDEADEKLGRLEQFNDVLTPRLRSDLASRASDMPQIIVEREVLEIQRETEVVRMDGNFKAIIAANRQGLVDANKSLDTLNGEVRRQTRTMLENERMSISGDIQQSMKTSSQCLDQLTEEMEELSRSLDKELEHRDVLREDRKGCAPCTNPLLDFCP